MASGFLSKYSSFNAVPTMSLVLPPLINMHVFVFSIIFGSRSNRAAFVRRVLGCATRWSTIVNDYLWLSMIIGNSKVFFDDLNRQNLNDYEERNGNLSSDWKWMRRQRPGVGDRKYSGIFYISSQNRRGVNRNQGEARQRRKSGLTKGNSRIEGSRILFSSISRDFS